MFFSRVRLYNIDPPKLTESIIVEKLVGRLMVAQAQNPDTQNESEAQKMFS